MLRDDYTSVQKFVSSYLLSPIVTPKSLLPKSSHPEESRAKNLEPQVLPLEFKAQIKLNKTLPEVPEFMASYMYKVPASSRSISSKLQNSRPMTQPVSVIEPSVTVKLPKATRSGKANRYKPHERRERTEEVKKHYKSKTDPNVQRIGVSYRPQILHISPRAKVKVYCPYPITHNDIPMLGPPKSIVSRKTAIPTRKRPEIVEEDNSLKISPSIIGEESIQPSRTYGEKLLKLTELSPITWFS